MSVCCPHAISAGKIYSKVARLHRWRSKKRKFGEAQVSLLRGLEHLGFKGASILEIGCGIGQFHQTLLERGAANALGIDLAAEMLREAERCAQQRGLGEKTCYMEGDFVNLADNVASADITVLDKVICCYPDVELLVNRSLSRTKWIYALVYPRNRWYTRLLIEFAALILWLIGSDFRPYVHDPVKIEAWASRRGFHKNYETETLMTVTQIYQYQ